MKNFLFGIGLLLLTSSCATVYFTTPQPQKGLVIKSFISDIQGNYADSLLNVSILKNKIIVNGEQFNLVASEPAKNEVVVKFYSNFYFASFRDSVYYSVFMAKFYENKLAVYMLNADARSIDVIKRFVPVQTLDAEKKEFLINATKKEFDQLIDNEIFQSFSVMTKK